VDISHDNTSVMWAV